MATRRRSSKAAKGPAEQSDRERSQLGTVAGEQTVAYRASVGIESAARAQNREPETMTTSPARYEDRPLPEALEFIEGASRAIEQAIRDLHARGIPTTHLSEGRLVRVHPDGRREDLGPPTRP